MVPRRERCNALAPASPLRCDREWSRGTWRITDAEHAHGFGDVGVLGGHGERAGLHDHVGRRDLHDFDRASEHGPCERSRIRNGVVPWRRLGAAFFAFEHHRRDGGGQGRCSGATGRRVLLAYVRLHWNLGESDALRTRPFPVSLFLTSGARGNESRDLGMRWNRPNGEERRRWVLDVCLATCRNLQPGQGF